MLSKKVLQCHHSFTVIRTIGEYNEENVTGCHSVSIRTYLFFFF